MNQLLGVEMLKIRKRMMTWILLAVLVAFMVLYVVFSYLSVTSSSSNVSPQEHSALKIALQFPLAFTLILSVTQSIGIILLIILAASLIGNEYGWGTVSQVIGRKGRRTLYMDAKVVALIVITLLLVLIGLAIGTLLSIFTTYKLAGGVNWDFFTSSFAGHLIKMFGWTAFTIMIYILLAMFFATLGRSVIAGIGGALGYHFIEAILVGVFNNASGWSHRIPDYLIGRNAQSLLVTGLDRGPFGSSTNIPSGLHATVVLIIYGMVFLGMILYIFRRQDLTA